MFGKRLLSSPSHTGPTTYGGASARRRFLFTTAPMRQQRPASAITAGEDQILSHTARRILAALEQFSAPLSGDSRIPTTAPALAAKQRAVEFSYTSIPKPPAEDLGLFKIRWLIERIQDTTMDARQVSLSSAATEDVPSVKPFPLPQTSNMVNKLKDQEKPPKLDGHMEPLQRPQVAQPITTLPKFDIPSFTFSNPHTVAENTESGMANPSREFNFSGPITPDVWVRQKSEPLCIEIPLLTPKSTLKKEPSVPVLPVPSSTTTTSVLETLSSSFTFSDPHAVAENTVWGLANPSREFNFSGPITPDVLVRQKSEPLWIDIPLLTPKSTLERKPSAPVPPVPSSRPTTTTSVLETLPSNFTFSNPHAVAENTELGLANLSREFNFSEPITPDVWVRQQSEPLISHWPLLTPKSTWEKKTSVQVLPVPSRTTTTSVLETASSSFTFSNSHVKNLQNWMDVWKRCLKLPKVDQPTTILPKFDVPSFTFSNPRAFAENTESGKANLPREFNFSGPITPDVWVWQKSELSCHRIVPKLKTKPIPATLIA